MNKAKELNQRIKDLQDQLDTFELDPDKYEDSYDEFLDEQGDIHIGNLSYTPSQVLKNVDPIAYNCGLLDYVDSLEKKDDLEYQEIQEELEKLESELEGLD